MMALPILSLMILSSPNAGVAATSDVLDSITLLVLFSASPIAKLGKDSTGGLLAL